MKNQTCCFTGHRHLAQEKLPQIEKALKALIIIRMSQGVTNFVCGGALGFDILAAEMVLSIKVKIPEIGLIMALPCRNQDKGWSFADKRRYKNVLKKADEVIYLSEKYYDGCMLDRNRYMIDNSACCIAYLTQNRGGTLFTVNYAKRNNVEVFNIADYEDV